MTDLLPSPWGPLAPDRRELRVYPERLDFMIWNDEDWGSQPHDWPISEQLQDDLCAWCRAWEHFEPGPRYLYPEDDPAFDLAGHNSRGAELAQRLQAELGPKWDVLHLPQTQGPPIVGPPKLQWPRPMSVKRRRVELLSRPLGSPADVDRLSSVPTPECALRDGLLLVTLNPICEGGFSYAVQALWRGRQALPADLLRSWSITKTEEPHSLIIPACEAMFDTFADAIVQQKPAQWISRHEDLVVTVLPSAWSPFRQQYFDYANRVFRTSDPPEEGYEVNLLFRATHESRFEPAKSGIALRLALSPSSLNSFMVAFATAHDRLKLRDEGASEEAGSFVPAGFQWPPEVRAIPGL